MTQADPLRHELARIAIALKPHRVDLIVGGGYGLLLRTERLIETQPRMRFEQPLIARATDDLDIFLGVEIITSGLKMAAVRDCLKALGYKPKTRYFQFQKTVAINNYQQTVKIDLLSPRPTSKLHIRSVHIKQPRIRPRDVYGVHAYLTEEAITLEEQIESITLTDGAKTVEVFLPHPFTYLVLKLFALRDHLDEDDKTKAPEHAFDIYRTIGMMTESQWNDCMMLTERFGTGPILATSAEIVVSLFSDTDARGAVEIYRLAGRTAIIEENVKRVVDDLKQLFPTEPE